MSFPDRSAGRSVAVALGLMLVGAIVSQVLLAGVIVGANAAGLIDSAIDFYGVASVVTGLGMVIVPGIYVWKTGRGAAFCKLRKPSGYEIVAGLAGGVGLFVFLEVSTAVLSALGVPKAPGQISQVAQETPELALVLAATSLVVTAPAEEFLFRGAIQSRLLEEFSARVSIGLTAALFGVLHFTSLSGTPVGVVTAVVVAVALSTGLGIAYHKSSSIATPIVMHGVYNALFLVSVYAEAVGMF